MGPDQGVSCRLYAAATLWLLGYPEQALTRVRETLALAHELSHPYSNSRRSINPSKHATFPPGLS